MKYLKNAFDFSSIIVQCGTNNAKYRQKRGANMPEKRPVSDLRDKVTEIEKQ